MCCCTGLTSCAGGCCGYCSECVGLAACNPVYCGTCTTGTVCGSCAAPCTPTAGTGTCICTPTSCSCFSVACLPYAGTDSNGNDIYQNANGSLTYADGSPATRGDIAYNCGACHNTPCSPMTCGSTDQPPRAGSKSGSSSGGPAGGGSGGGTAKPSGGKANPKCTQMSKLSQSMNHFGSTITALLGGGKRTPTNKVLPGQATGKVKATTISSNTFLLIIIVVGGLLLMMAFGHKAEGV